jgi:hypothetical protein
VSVLIGTLGQPCVTRKKQNMRRRPQQQKKNIPRQPKRGSPLWQARKIRQYDALDETMFNELLNEPFEIVRRVLSKLQVERNLPPILDCVFPSADQFAWYPPPRLKGATLEAILRLSIARVVTYSEKLNKFVDLQRKFTESLVTKKWSNSESLLERYEKLFGVSSWWLESRLLLADCIGGFERTRDELTKILKLPLPNNALVVAEFASQRVDATMSIIEYIRQVHSMVANGRHEETEPSLPTYLCFILNVPNIGFTPPSSQEMSYILRAELTRPVIDCYLSLKRLLWLIASSDSFKILDSDTKTALNAFSKLVDPSVQFVNQFLASTSAAQTLDEITRIQAEVLYDPEHAITQCVELVRNDSTSFANYELLSTACVMSDCDVPVVFDTESLAQRLLEGLREFLSYRESTVQAYWFLLKCANSLSSTCLGHQLGAFALKCHPVPLSIIRREKCIHYFTSQAGMFPSLVGLNSKTSLQDQSDTAPKNVAPLLAQATDLLCQESDGDAISLFRQIIKQDPIDNYCYTEAVRGVVEAMVKTNQCNSAVQVLSDSRIPPILLNFIVPVKRLIASYSKQNSETDVSLIGWPILFLFGNIFNNVPSRQLHSAYANFLEAHKCSYPHQLLELGDSRFASTQLQAFLHGVCTIDCIQSDISFGGTDEVEHERMLLLQQLQLLDPDSATSYASEISQLQQQIAIRKAINYVSESKVYFNTEGIEKSLPKTYYEQFKRYLQYKKLSVESRLIPSDTWTINDDGIRKTRDGAFVLFYQLFNEIRHAVLFSNEHGLDSYLSVRIRHQTIKGAIRSVFDQLRLIADMEKGVYRVGEQWFEGFGLVESSLRNEIETAIIRFSVIVDHIIDKVSGKWMRIREPGLNGEGWFDLDFAESELELVSERLLDIEDELMFLDNIIYIIRERVNDVLVTVRQKVYSILGVELDRALDQLSNDLELLNPGIPLDLTGAITRCRTALQNELREIANWFQLQDVLRLEDFPFRTLLQASIENVRKCFPSSNFSCAITGGSTLVIGGRFFPALWDLCFLLFENVVKHSDELSNATTVLVSQTSETLTLRFSNRLNANQISQETLDRIKAAQIHEPAMIRMEGGSGFAKIRNILESDLRMGKESFRVEIQDDVFEAVVTLTTSLITV